MFGSQSRTCHFSSRVWWTRFARKGRNWWPSIACASPREHPEVRHQELFSRVDSYPKHHGVESYLEDHPMTDVSG